MTDMASGLIGVLERVGRLVRGLQHAEGIKPAQWEALRFLARANRFSRSPGALSEFLGSTRGTVSQTLIALERKGFVKRLPSPRDGRGTALELTDSGRALVAGDPMLELEDVARELEPATAEALYDGLGALLGQLQQRHGYRAFGLCSTCRYFRRGAAAHEAGGPHRCGVTGEMLSEGDSTKICREHNTKQAA